MQLNTSLPVLHLLFYAPKSLALKPSKSDISCVHLALGDWKVTIKPPIAAAALWGSVWRGEVPMIALFPRSLWPSPTLLLGLKYQIRIKTREPILLPKISMEHLGLGIFVELSTVTWYFDGPVWYLMLWILTRKHGVWIRFSLTINQWIIKPIKPSDILFYKIYKFY